MSAHNKYYKNNAGRLQQNDYKYKPTIVGKIALCFAVPAAVIGIIAILLAFVIASLAADLLVVTLIAEAVAVVGGIIIGIDIVVFTAKNKKELEKSGIVEKKEKDISHLIHFVVGLGLGLLLGFLIWGR